MLERFGVHVTDPKVIFSEIDTNHGGYILFDEFCSWAIRKSFDFHKE